MGERRSCLVRHRSGLRRGCDHGRARRRSHEYRLCRIDPRSTVASIESDDSTTSTSGTTTVVVPASISSTVSTLTDVSDIAAIAVTSVARVETTVSFRGRERVAASGSGVIVDGQGTIVTNTHVVETGTGVDVTLNDGSTHTGTVIGVDTDHDLAVISIDCTGLTPVEFGSSEDLLVGDPVIAIGYLKPVHAGHVDVQDHEIRSLCSDRSERIQRPLRSTRSVYPANPRALKTRSQSDSSSSTTRIVAFWSIVKNATWDPCEVLESRV